MPSTKLTATAGPLAAACLLVLAGTPVSAAEKESYNTAPTGIPDPSIATSLPQNGDADGSRAWLAQHGFTYGLSYYGEVMGNPSGGFSQGTIYDGRAKIVVDLDLEKIIGWKGLSFHGNAYQIHGQGLTRDHIGNLLTATSVEALPSTRLYKASFDQKLGDKLSVRFGQFPADAEFVVSDNAVSQFINTTFGWPALNQSNLPSAGPAYPLTALGVRVKYDPSERLTLMAATFDGDPAGPGKGDPQQRNNDGLNFRLKDAPFSIAEAQFHFKDADSAIGLPGTFKVGGWYHAGRFDDQRYDANGVPLAVSGGAPRRLSTSHALYGVLDQQIYRVPGGDAANGVHLFGRITAAPADRSVFDLYIDGGLRIAGMVPRRPDDSIGLGFAYGRIGDGRRADQDAVALGSTVPVRDYEAVLELNYTAQIVPGWTVTPDLQYIIHPGGLISDPKSSDPAKPIPDATVVGARTLIRY
jgi:porin